MDEQRAIISPDKAEGPFILAIDIGTSSVKTLLFDQLGRAIESVQWREAFKIRTSKEGASEVDPDALLEIVWRGIDSLISKAGKLADEFAGVAICTFVGNIMGIDQRGRAITPLMTYADTRAEEDAVRLKSEFDEAEVHERTGCHIHSSYLPARFRWMARSQPHLFCKVTRWISLGEYMELKLFGEATISYSVASWTGLFDRQRLIWDKPLLAKLPVKKKQLSTLVDINNSKGGLYPEFASRWPALHNLPWFPAIGDGAAANIGSGCTTASHLAVTIGTTTAIRAIVNDPVPHVPEGLWCYRVDGRRSLAGGAMSEGGSLFTWMKNVLQLGDLTKLEPAIKELPPNGHGLTVLPFLSGERSPGWQGRAKATIHGISSANSPMEIFQAGLEAVAYRIAPVFDKLVEILPAEPQVVVSGGAIQAIPVWIQIITDVLGRTTVLSTVQEASARGAALLVAETLGLVKLSKDVAAYFGRTFHPVAGRHGIYLEALKRQQWLYEKLVKDGR
jgi:gluconokinase